MEKENTFTAEFTSRTFSLCDRNRHSFADYYDPLLFSLFTAIRFRRIKGTILLSFFFFLSALSSLRCSSPPSSLHFITLQSSRRAPARRLWCPNEVSSLRKLRRQLDSPLPSSRSHVYQSCIIRQARRKITLFNSHSRESLSSDSFLFCDRRISLFFFFYLPYVPTRILKLSRGKDDGKMMKGKDESEAKTEISFIGYYIIA